MKTPKKSSKRHSLESNYPENSPSKKQKRNQRMEKFEEAPETESYSQNVVESSQQTVNTVMRGKLDKHNVKRSIVKQSSSIFCNSEQDPQISKKKNQRNPPSMALEYYFSPKKKIHSLNEEESSYDVKREFSDSDETASELRNIVKSKKSRINADKSKNSSNTFIIKSVESIKIESNKEDSENEFEILKKKKSKPKVKARKKRGNTLLSMIEDSTSCSDSDIEDKTHDNTIQLSLNKRKKQIANRSRPSEICTSSDEEDDKVLHQQSISESNNVQRFDLKEEAEDVVENKFEILKKKESKPKVKARKRQGNTLLSMIKDSTSCSDSDIEDKTHDNTIHLSLNKRKEKIASKSRPKTCTSSDEEDDKVLRQQSISESNNVQRFDLEEEAEDVVENEFEILKKTESKPKVKARKKQGNTLLSMIKDSTSCSDSDIEDKTDDNTIHLSLNKRKKKISSRSRPSEICTSSEKEDDKVLHQQSISESNNVQRFDLKEEAEDVVENKFEILKKKESKPKVKARKKQGNTLLSMIKDSTSCSDSDIEDKTDDNTIHLSLNKRKKKISSRSRPSEICTSSEKEDDKVLHQQSISESNNVQRFDLKEEAEDVVENKFEILKKKESKPKVKARKKQGNTLLSMIKDSTSCSDSDIEDKTHDNTIHLSLNKRKEKIASKSRPKTCTSSDEEDDKVLRQQSISESNNVRRFDLEEKAEDVVENEFEILKKTESKPKVKARKKQGNTLLSMIKDSTSCSDSDIEDKTHDNTIHLPLNKRKKKISSRSRPSEICTSSDKEDYKVLHQQSISESNNVQRFDLEEEAEDVVENKFEILKKTESKPKVKARKKQGNTLLSMIKDSTSCSDSDIEDKTHDNIIHLPLNKRKEKIASKSRPKICTSSDEEDDKVLRQQSIGESNNVHRFDLEEEAEDVVENEFERLKKKESKPKVKARKEQGNTLLSMIEDSTSCSDSDIEDKTDDNTIHLSLNKRKKKIASRSRPSEICTSSDEEDDKVFGESNNVQRFDLEEEAKDVEEMINVLETENQLPKDALRKLSKLKVKLSHQVPPQHMVETCAGSRGPTKEQKKIIEKLGPIKYGKFTPEEDNIIMRNWKSFCKTHDWDSKDFRPFLYMRHQNIGFIIKFEHRQKFVQYLANGLPWRTLYSVYWRYRNICQPHIQSRYTPDEDKLIIAHMNNNANGDSKNVRKFSELAKILSRTRASVWRRWRLLKKHEKPKSINWNLRLVKKFIENLMLLTLSDDIRQLKDLDIPRLVWNKLSTKMKILSKTLKYFWVEKLHMQLFCEMPIYLNDIRIKLIEYFYVKGMCEWWEIEWSTVAKHFDGMTSIFLAQTFSRLFYNEKLEGMSLGEIVEYGYKTKKPDLQEAIMDACLPRISFKNGTVKLLDLKSNNNLRT